MYCKKCGKQVPDDSLFCSYCGEQFIVSDNRRSKGTLNLLDNFQKYDRKIQICVMAYIVWILLWLILWVTEAFYHDGGMFFVIFAVAIPVCTVIVWYYFAKLRRKKANCSTSDNKESNNNSIQCENQDMNIFTPQKVEYNQFVKDYDEVEFKKYGNMHTGRHECYCSLIKFFLLDPSTSITSSEELKSNAEKLLVDRVNKKLVFADQVEFSIPQESDIANSSISFMAYYKSYDGAKFFKVANNITGAMEYYVCLYKNYLIDPDSGISTINGLNKNADHLWVDNTSSTIYLNL